MDLFDGGALFFGRWRPNFPVIGGKFLLMSNDSYNLAGRVMAPTVQNCLWQKKSEELQPIQDEAVSDGNKFAFGYFCRKTCKASHACTHTFECVSS